LTNQRTALANFFVTKKHLTMTIDYGDLYNNH